MRTLASQMVLLMLVAFAAWVHAQSGPEPRPTLDQLELHNVKAEAVKHKNRLAIRVVDDGPADRGLAIVRGTSFTNGTIEIDVAGEPSPNASGDARGFAGVAFHVAPDAARFENFYLRFTNGRAEEQLRRNHSAQYMSLPDFPWSRLRAEAPGKYESYVDLVPGEWTKIRIVISGDKGQLYVNGASQPTLIVNDLKMARSNGAIALWVGPATIAHFANLKISP